MHWKWYYADAPGQILGLFLLVVLGGLVAGSLLLVVLCGLVACVEDLLKG